MVSQIVRLATIKGRLDRLEQQANEANSVAGLQAAVCSLLAISRLLVDALEHLDRRTLDL